MGDRVSIVMTSYNRARFLPEALDSALNQTHPSYEIIVCDDCSTDGSREIIETYRRKYPNVIKPIYQEKNVGISRNRNAGMRKIQGDYFCFLSDDDYFYPRKLELELAAIRRSKCAQWAYSDVDLVDVSGKKLRSFINSANAVEGNIFKEIVLLRVDPRDMLISTAALQKIGFFDEELLLWEDWDFKIRLSKRFEVVHVPQVLTVYRIHEGGIHKTKPAVHIEQVKKVIEKTDDLLMNLPEQEAEEIRQGLDYIMLEHRVSYALDEGQRYEAWKCLWKLLKTHPAQTLYYKLALKVILPAQLYRLMVKVKHSLV